MSSPFEAFVVIELRDNVISCSEPLLCYYVILHFPLYITMYSSFYLQLLFLSLSIYTRTLPPLDRTLGSATLLVQIAGSVSNLATDLATVYAS